MDRIIRKRVRHRTPAILSRQEAFYPRAGRHFEGPQELVDALSDNRLLKAMLSFVQQWPWLFQPLGGATRFFRTVPEDRFRTMAVLWRGVLLLAALGLLHFGIELLSWEMTAELRAALKRLPETPYAEPFLAWPWSQFSAMPAFMVVWLVYLLIFATLRWLGGRRILRRAEPGPAAGTAHAATEIAWSFSRALVYSTYAAVPVMLIATLSKFLQLTLLPTDPANLLVPSTGAVYLPLVLFVLGFFAEAWIFTRALRTRHSVHGNQSLLVFAMPLLVFTAIVLLYLFVVAMYNASL